MGVGPEQNFTYIAAIRPKMAFIVDIRRQAVDAASDVQGDVRAGEGPRRFHLAPVLQAAARRASTRRRRSRRCGRPIATVATDSALRHAELRARRRSADEDARIHVSRRTSRTSSRRCSTRSSITARHRDARARATGAAATSPISPAPRPTAPASRGASCRRRRTTGTSSRCTRRNLIVPVSGDFGGPKAIRAIGAYLKEHDGTRPGVLCLERRAVSVWRRTRTAFVLCERRHAADRLDERVHSAVLDAPRFGGRAVAVAVPDRAIHRRGASGARRTTTRRSPA